jgi:hypothetical protein
VGLSRELKQNLFELDCDICFCFLLFYEHFPGAAFRCHASGFVVCSWFVVMVLPLGWRGRVHALLISAIPLTHKAMFEVWAVLLLPGVEEKYLRSLKTKDKDKTEMHQSRSCSLALRRIFMTLSR